MVIQGFSPSCFSEKQGIGAFNCANVFGLLQDHWLTAHCQLGLAAEGLGNCVAHLDAVDALITELHVIKLQHRLVRSGNRLPVKKPLVRQWFRPNRFYAEDNVLCEK